MTIRTAILSVSDKTGLVPLARRLAARGVTLLSSGGTARALEAEGVAVRTVESYTGSPEVMDGRVKTLHPRVHGGILSRGEVDTKDLERIGGVVIDLVVVNLYPFEQTVAEGADRLRVIENIDIGGPSMLRSAAKNHLRVTAVCDPADYEAVMEAIESGGEVPEPFREELAAKAFAHTAAYDAAISKYLSGNMNSTLGPFPRHLLLPFERAYTLRYGENPHQSGAFYVERGARVGTVARAESLGGGGKELSFNNLVDVDAALDCAREFDRAAAVVVKHTNPCGVALGDTLEAAYRAARDDDPLSAFGGIVALNREVDTATARALAETFLECVVAPRFEDGALAILRAKKNLRLLSTGAWLGASYEAIEYKRIGGGIVAQTRDASAAGEVANGRVVTRRAPSPAEFVTLDFAWKIAKHVKSNAIVLAREERTVGVGAGQMSRVVSVEIACKKAGELASGSVLASDAYFPFPDGVATAARAGVTAIAQPGGSVKDGEVIAAADAAGCAMVFTGVRHFRH